MAKAAPLSWTPVGPFHPRRFPETRLIYHPGERCLWLLGHADGQVGIWRVSCRRPWTKSSTSATRARGTSSPAARSTRGRSSGSVIRRHWLRWNDAL